MSVNQLSSIITTATSAASIATMATSTLIDQIVAVKIGFSTAGITIILVHSVIEPKGTVNDLGSRTIVPSAVVSLFLWMSV